VAGEVMRYDSWTAKQDNAYRLVLGNSSLRRLGTVYCTARVLRDFTYRPHVYSQADWAIQCIPFHRASLHFGRYSFPVRLSWPMADIHVICPSSIERARRRATSLIHPTPLPLRQITTCTWTVRPQENTHGYKPVKRNIQLLTKKMSVIIAFAARKKTVKVN